MPWARRSVPPSSRSSATAFSWQVSILTGRAPSLAPSSFWPCCWRKSAEDGGNNQVSHDVNQREEHHETETHSACRCSRAHGHGNGGDGPGWLSLRARAEGHE